MMVVSIDNINEPSFRHRIPEGWSQCTNTQIMSSNISLLSTNPLELDVKLSERPPQLVVRHLAQRLCEVAVRLWLDRSPADRRHRRGISEPVRNK